MMRERLDTKRLILRRFEEDDIDPFYEVLGEPLVGRWLRGVDDKKGFTREQTRTWLMMFNAHWEEEGFGPFAVVLRENDRLIGHCGIRYNPRYQWEEGMYGLHPVFWRNGYMTEAYKAVLYEGFTELGFEKVYDYTLVENAASIGLKRRLGFTYVKNFDHKGFDHVLYELERDDFIHP